MVPTTFVSGILVQLKHLRGTDEGGTSFFTTGFGNGGGKQPGGGGGGGPPSNGGGGGGGGGVFPKLIELYDINEVGGGRECK